jgi:hypothetical protein
LNEQLTIGLLTIENALPMVNSQWSIVIFRER